MSDQPHQPQPALESQVASNGKFAAIATDKRPELNDPLPF
jgi:hypothetical protein